MLEYLKNKEGFLSQLLKHLQTSAIMDLLLKLVTCVENRTSKLEISQWLCSERLVERLVGLFGVGSEPALHGNAAQLLCDLLRLLRDVHAQNSHLLPSLHETSPEVGVGDQPDVDPIVSVLEAKSTTDQLLEQMLGGPVTESAVVHGITVLLTLLEVRRPPQLMSSDSEAADRTPPDPVITPCIRNTVEAIIPRIKDFHDILLQPPEKTDSSPPASASQEPFGFVRLQVSRLIAALIGTGSSEVQRELASLGTLSTLLDMMMKFHHSNFLHSQVERSIQCILGLEPIDLLQPSQPSSEEPADGGPHENEQPLSASHPLLTHLLTETQLVRRILDAWQANELHQTQAGGLRRAYMGHLIWIANYVVDFEKQGKNSSKIRRLVQELPDDLRQQWLDFVDTQLAQANRNNEIIPVKSNMMAPKVNSDEEEPDIIRSTITKDTALQEVFSDYQMEVMSKHIVTQFGFADNQFHDNDDPLRPPPDTLVSITLPEDGDELSHQSELFEQVCNERMEMRPKAHVRPGDNDDDDIWLERAGRHSSDNTSTVRPETSSDEEETLAEDAADSMDIDQSSDPWATTGTEAATGPVAMDAGNPWQDVAAVASAASGSAQDDAGDSDDWANFAKADFSDACFVAAATADAAAATPMDVSETPASPASAAVSEEALKDDSTAAASEVVEEAPLAADAAAATEAAAATTTTTTTTANGPV